MTLWPLSAFQVALPLPVRHHAVVGFLLDAALGLINIEQNGIIKFFSVVAVVFLPPTLVASVYGMNFDIMPELRWKYGYPAVVAAIMAICVYLYTRFKRSRWL